MAKEVIMAIITIPLFKRNVGTNSTSLDSDPIDLREIHKEAMSLSYNVGTSGGIATCGSSNFIVLTSQFYEGDYISPTGGTCSTSGNTGGSGLVALTPPTSPFMKIRATIGSSGTSLITASLNVR
jgi:hypothetical protein